MSVNSGSQVMGLFFFTLTCSLEQGEDMNATGTSTARGQMCAAEKSLSSSLEDLVMVTVICYTARNPVSSLLPRPLCSGNHFLHKPLPPGEPETLFSAL